MAELIKGLDVSVYQGDKINWKAVAQAGYKFVICRCGVGNSSKDKNYEKNIAGAKAVGLKVAAYHFVYPLPTIPNQPLRDPKAQAKLHADWAGKNILAACDLEWPEPENWKKWGCTAQQIIDWAIVYLEEYERLTGVRPIVYTYPYFAKAVNLPPLFAEKYKLWIASYTATPAIPKPWTDWVIWQDSGGKTTNLPGGGPVDTNKARDLSWFEEFENREPMVIEPVVEPPPPPPNTNPTPEPVPGPGPDLPPVTPPTPAPVPPPGPAQLTNPLVAFFSLIGGLFSKLFKR